MKMITLLTLLFLGSAGCSQMRPTAKSQTQTVIAFGLPALAIVSETHMGATNSGDDENTNDFDATNDVKPNVDVPVEVK